MSKKTARKTNIQVRTLDEDAKKNIRGLLKYGDVRRISELCDWITYDQVSNVLRGVSENDKVWKVTLEYLNDLPSVELSDRLAAIINKKEVA